MMFINNYNSEVLSYMVQLIREKDDGKTTDIRQYDCETFDEVVEFIKDEMWSYWDCFKVWAFIMNGETGELEQVYLK